MAVRKELSLQDKRDAGSLSLQGAGRNNHYSDIIVLTRREKISCAFIIQTGKNSRVATSAVIREAGAQGRHTWPPSQQRSGGGGGVPAGSHS